MWVQVIVLKDKFPDQKARNKGVDFQRLVNPAVEMIFFEVQCNKV